MTIEGVQQELELGDGGDGEDTEQEARNLGWQPKEDFKGNPNQWVDHAEFVERGRHIVPILKDNNKRLQKELQARDAKINQLGASLANNEAAVARMEAHWLAANKRAVKQAKQELKEELKRAREAEDTDAELDVLERLNDNSAQEKALNEPAPAKVAPVNSTDPSPEYVEFIRENPWFDVDKKRTKAVVRIAEDLREDGNTLEGKAFFDECVRILGEQESGSGSGRAASKVESGNAGAGRANGARKGWADLPKDAQTACLSDADVLVGADKRYKTLDAWKKKYAEIYFSGE